MESVYEQIFGLKYYGAWSLIELYSMPIGLRDWFAKRLTKQLKEEADRNK